MSHFGFLSEARLWGGVQVQSRRGDRSAPGLAPEARVCGLTPWGNPAERKDPQPGDLLSEEKL